MKKKVITLSLGGSLIIPENINESYLKEFKKTLKKHSKKYSFAVVCGGGSLARKYIDAVKKETKNLFLESLAGIAATRVNARFMSYYFGYDQKKGIPHKMRTLKKYLKKRKIVFCGALEYAPNQTSDSTAAKIAKQFHSSLVNLTNVKGLYDKDPKKFKGAKLIKEISHKDFLKLASKMKFSPGQHFVLDQNAAKIIKEENIKTAIIKDLKELDNFLKGKKFTGTIIG